MRTSTPIWAGLLVLAGAALFALGRPAPVTGEEVHAGHGDHGPMTEADMKRWADAWWAAHPRVGTHSIQAPDQTFQVVNFRFDLDGSAATQVDTARITAGGTVRWVIGSGFHSITSGIDNADPNAGLLFDQPSDAENPEFAFTFFDPGTYPFFCRPHDVLQMKGVVVVTSTTDAGPPSNVALGFTRDPSPNPTQRGTSFGFSLRHPGRALAEVFDANGRRIAVVLDGELPAGPQVAAWDGRIRGGGRAAVGRYHLRLRLPGFDGTRSIVVAR